MASFPSALASFIGFISSHTLSQDQHAAQHNLEQAEILSTQTKIGTGASTPTSGTVLRGNGTGTSGWGQVNQSTDVTGVLPQANGGTGTTLSTGSGKGVYDTSPTINSPSLNTPTISDFTNAQHGHTNAAGGGTLNGANALQAGSVNFTNLLSTIFSGQVQTQANAGSGGGTMWWVNLGGIKLLWGQSAAFQNTSSGFNATFTLPTFFSSLQAGFSSIDNLGTTPNQNSNISTFTTSSINVATWSVSNTVSTETVSLFVIGT